MLEDFARKMLESQVDTFLKDPAKHKIFLEDLGLEPTENNIIIYHAGFFTATFAASYKVSLGRTPTEEEYTEFFDLLKRRIVEMQNAFMR